VSAILKNPRRSTGIDERTATSRVGRRRYAGNMGLHTRTAILVSMVALQLACGMDPGEVSTDETEEAASGEVAEVASAPEGPELRAVCQGVSIRTYRRREARLHLLPNKLPVPRVAGLHLAGEPPPDGRECQLFLDHPVPND
jgi:hypothetical protein